MLLAIQGLDCSKKPRYLFLSPYPRLSRCLFFGISGYILSSSGAVPVCDAGFDITSPEQQELLLNVSTEARWRADLEVRPSVLTWIKVFRKRHRADFPIAQDAAAPFLKTFFDNWWYEDNGTDESGDFLWTRLKFKINRLSTASASSLEPLQDKWVTFAHEMNRQAGLDLVPSLTWSRKSGTVRAVAGSRLSGSEVHRHALPASRRRAGRVRPWLKSELDALPTLRSRSPCASWAPTRSGVTGFPRTAPLCP